jgi:hypothetical protein
LSPKAEGRDARPLLVLATLILGIAVFTGGGMAFAVWIFSVIKIDRPEVVLPTLLVTGLIGLLAAIGGLVALFRITHLTQAKQALGLPEGSVRAIIAFSLVLIFAVMGLYLHGASGGGREIMLTGVLESELAQIPVEDRIATTRIAAGGADEPVTYNVTRLLTRLTRSLSSS